MLGSRGGSRGVRRLAAPVALLALTSACSGSTGGPEPSAGPDGPNIVVIMTDDQRWDTVDQLPALDGWDRWARFEHAFVHEPICCPSRATALTGRFSHHTTVEQIGDVADFDDADTVATRLHDAGYATGFFGKYLAGYGRAAPPPGWDRFVRFTGSAGYVDHELNVDGEVVPGTGYSTDDLAARAVEFIREAPPDQPVFVAYWPFAPHGASFGPPLVADRHRDVCGDPALPPAPPDPDGGTDEAPWVHEMVATTDPLVMDGLAYRWAESCDSLRAVDEAFTLLLDVLEETGRADDTYLIFTSDNGWSFGERGLTGKGHLYEESVRVPLLVAGPDVEPGTVERLTSNVDLVPTILDWAGVPAGEVDGTSFAGVLRGEGDDGPDAILLRGCPILDDDLECFHGRTPEPGGDVWGLRTLDRKLVLYPDGSVDLFDLEQDPGEVDDVSDDPARAGELADLRARLDELLAAAGAT